MTIYNNKDKIVFIFNSQLYSLIEDLKNINFESNEVKYLLENKNLKSVDNLLFFKNHINAETCQCLINKDAPVDILKNDEKCQNLQIVPNLFIKDIVKETDTNENDSLNIVIVYKYVISFILFMSMFELDNIDNDTSLFDNTINAQRCIQENKDFEEILDEINNIRIKKILRKLSNVSAMEKVSDFSNVFENKEFKKIAHEIAEELMNDPNLQVQVNNVQDLINLFSSGKLQSVIDKGLHCIKRKFGESNINQQAFVDELMKIVMKMMSQTNVGSGGGAGGNEGMPNIINLIQSFSGLVNTGTPRIDDGKLRKQNQKMKLQQNLKLLKEMENKK